MTIKERVVQKFISLFKEAKEKREKTKENLKNDMEQNRSGILHYGEKTNSSQALELFVQQSQQECEIVNAINFLAFLEKNEKILNTRVAIGSLFGIKSIETEEPTYYFAIPQQGGDTITMELWKKTITTVSTGSALFQNAIGKRKGEKFEMGGKLFEIIEVY